MRVATLLLPSKLPNSWRAIAARIVSKLLPVWFLKKTMESQFINFGIEISNICNANCSFCAYRFQERDKVVIPWEVLKKSIDEFSDAGGGSVNFTPTVGDPLVDKKLLEKIKYASSFKNINTVFLYTNGILLHRFGYDEILDSGLTRLAISTFIGSREGYKKYYGKDKYDQVMRNIEQIAIRNRDKGYPVLITLHLRVSQEQDEWRETRIFKSIVGLIGEQNIDYLNEYDSWSSKINQDDLPKGCEINKALPLEVKKKSPCFELYRRVHVLADGNVGACVCTDLNAEINIGNVNNQSLKEIWKGKRLKEYRKKWVEGDLPDVCVNCTRYMPVDEFIENSRRRIVIDFIRRTYPRLFRLLTNKSYRSSMFDDI